MSPDVVEELPGWLLPMDAGTVGRAHSAVPLQHAGLAREAAAQLAAEIETRYVARGLQAVWRLPRVSAFQALHDELAHRGYAMRQPTLTQVGSVLGLAALSGGVEAILRSTPDDDWAAVFFGEGFDPVDGAHRVRLLKRGQHNVYAGVELAGELVAVAAAGFSQGWASVHGMRCLPAARRSGHASAILRAIAGEAQRRGISQVFLQVEEANAGARALYQRAGFSTAWAYGYWRRPPAGATR